MKIAIITAMQSEYDAVHKLYKFEKKEKQKFMVNVCF